MEILILREFLGNVLDRKRFLKLIEILMNFKALGVVHIIRIALGGGVSDLLRHEPYLKISGKAGVTLSHDFFPPFNSN
jgi:hypothetical protein